MPRDPFKLPPFKVEAVVTAASEQMDWGMTLFGIPKAWKAAGQGEGIKGVVLDTGQPIHADLEGAIFASEDFVGSGKQDRNGHSTHCCGIIGARQNKQGTVGVIPKCALATGKVLDDDGSGDIPGIVDGIYWAMSLKPDFISMSLGSSQDDPRMRKALEEANEAGIPIICASGNEGPGEGTMGYPGQYPFVVGVGAVDQNGKLAKFSSKGPGMDICGPGVNILSTYLNGRYAKLSGTSMATPFVAGVIGLNTAYRNKNSLPPITNHDELLQLLYASATDAGPPGFDTGFGYGLVNPADLLKPPPTPPGPPTEGTWIQWSAGPLLSPIIKAAGYIGIMVTAE